MQFIDIDQLLQKHTDLFASSNQPHSEYFVCQSVDTQEPNSFFYHFPKVVLCHKEKNEKGEICTVIDYPTPTSIDEQRKFHETSPHVHYLKESNEWSLSQVKQLIDSINEDNKDTTK